MTRQRRNHTAVAVAFGVAIVASLTNSVTNTTAYKNDNSNNYVKHHYNTRNSTQYDSSHPYPVQSQSVLRRRLNDNTNNNNNDGEGEPPPNYYDHPNYYAHLIVHYHKTGHHLSHQLRDLLLQASNISSSSSSLTFFPPLQLYSNEQEHAFKSRNHEMETGCPAHMYLPPGIVSVQAAPDLFCQPEILAEYLLRNAKAMAATNDDNDDDASAMDDNNKNNNNIVSGRTDDTISFRDAQSQQPHAQQPQYFPPREKRGIKIIHLVRNPYTLAISNWIYHTQYPTPEPWVKSIDPCTPEFWREHESLASMVSPTLLSGSSHHPPIMQYEDFDALHSICTSLFRTMPDSQEWSYYTHLRHLEPPTDSLSLATSHMMIQGISGGDILRMANNIIKLKQVQQLEERMRLSRHDLSSAQSSTESTTVPRMIQVLTLSMDDFMTQPRESTLRFLDFALHDTVVSREIKEELAMQYEQSYHEKLSNADDIHITANKVVTNGQEMDLVQRKEEWIEYLRGHELFGRILGNIEQLVNGALEEGGV